MHTKSHAPIFCTKLFVHLYQYRYAYNQPINGIHVHMELCGVPGPYPVIAQFYANDVLIVH